MSTLFDTAGVFWVPTEAKPRLVDALTMLRDAHPRTVDVLVHLDWWNRRDNRTVGAGAGWAYLVGRRGIHYEPEAAWWAGDPDPDDPTVWWGNATWDTNTGWHRTPAGLVTWPELANVLADHPDRPAVVEWATGQPWSELHRPNILRAPGDQWGPDYTTAETARPGWAARLVAWETTLAILDHTIAQLTPRSTP